MNKQIFVRYAQIKNEMKALKQEEDELNKQVLDELEKEGVVKAESDFGTFSVVEKKTYKFDDELQEKINKMKNQIKLNENLAIQDGLAEETITKSLRYTNAKN